MKQQQYSRQPRSVPRTAAFLLVLSAALSGCVSTGPRVSVDVPIIPGVSVGVGVGSGGASAGVSAGAGPVAVGVGVNQSGQVTGTAGVGASVPVGDARVGTTVGTSGVLYDPKKRNASRNAAATSAGNPSAP